MTQRRLGIGSRAERLCRWRLRLAGWRILDANWKTAFGELDLVAIDRRTLVFVEVKAFGPGSDRRSGPERPVLAVGPDKQARLARLGEAWLAAEDKSGRVPERIRNVRFDVIGIVLDERGRSVAWEHLRDAFVLPDRQA